MKRIFFLTFSCVLLYWFYDLGFRDSYPQIGYEIDGVLNDAKQMFTDFKSNF